MVALAALPAGCGLIGGSPEDTAAAPGWALYTKATAAEADDAAALQRTFGAAACDVRDDRARNGSQPDRPLHPAFIAKNEAATAWFVEKTGKTSFDCGAATSHIPR
jgi:hypothetical protein